MRERKREREKERERERYLPEFRGAVPFYDVESPAAAAVRPASDLSTIEMIIKWDHSDSVFKIRKRENKFIRL